MEAALTGMSDMLFVWFLFSFLWLSSLRGVHGCGGRHGLGSRLGLLGLFVFSFLFLDFVQGCMLHEAESPRCQFGGPWVVCREVSLGTWGA